MIAIDPGNEKSAIAFLNNDQGGMVAAWTKSNEELRQFLRNSGAVGGTVMAIEMIASYGMPVGAEVFETCLWIGRFIEVWTSLGGTHVKVYRKAVKLHLCGTTKAKDANVRQAILDKYGGKEKAIGSKKAPGPLYGISGDEWSALAVALTARDAPDLK